MPREINLKVLIPVGGAIIFAGVAGFLYYKLFDKEDDLDMEVDDIPFVSLTKVEVPIPKSAVGAIIGRQGCNIKQIQESTATAINFKDEENGERTCVIKGKLEKVMKAKELILKALQDIPDIINEEIEIPNNMIGKIIGRNGDTIQRLQKTSGAKIKVSDIDKNETSFAGPQSDYLRKIIIKGTREQICAARSKIFNIVEEENKLKMEIRNSASNISQRSKGVCEQNGVVYMMKDLDLDEDQMSNEDFHTLESPDSSSSADSTISLSDFSEAYVSAVVTGANFFVQFVGPKTVELDKLVREMSEYYEVKENREAHALSKFEFKKIVAAKFSDGMWYRGEIIEPDVEGQKEVTVFFLDFGDTESVDPMFVCDLRTDFLTLSYQAIECFLADVDPESAVNEEAQEAFEALSYVAQWKSVMIRVMGYKTDEREGSGSTPYVKVIDTSGPKHVDIGEEMIKRGLVKRLETSKC